MDNESHGSTSFWQKKYTKPVLIVLVFLVFVAGLDTAYYFLVLGQTTPQKTQAVTRVQPPSLAMVVSTIHSTLTSNDPTLVSTGTADLANTTGFPVSGSSVAVLVPYVAATAVSFSDPSTTSEVAAYAAYQQALPVIEKTLTNASFTPLTADNTATNLETILYFQRSDAVCQITSYSLLDISCIPSTTLTTIAQTAQPLITAYKSAYPTASLSAVATPVIQASQTPGYDIASLAVYGANGETKLNLYKQGTAAWQVVNLDWYNDPHENATIEPNCADFNTLPETRSAFKGLACYDSAITETSTIQ